MTRRLAAAILGCVLGVLVACQTDPAPVSVAADPAYAERIESYREGRNERIRTSWLSLSGLHWLEEGDNRFGSATDNEIVFPADASPALAGTLVYSEGEVFLDPVAGSGLKVNGHTLRPVKSKLKLEPDGQQLGLGRLEFFLIARSGKHGIRVRDPELPAVRDFEGIDFYPIDPSYIIEGKLRPFPETQTLTIETVIGHDTQMKSRGTVEFEFAGTTHRLVAMGESEELFLMFKDETSGNETYSAGRYLYAPVVDDIVTLDFNMAYNPPCAFTPYATCPLPPYGNTIAAKIEAGERGNGPGKHK